MRYIQKSVFQYARTVVGVTAVAGAVLSLSACDLARNTLKADRGGNMEMQDYRDALAPRQVDVNELQDFADTSSVPAMRPYVSSDYEKTKPMPLVSISVNQTVPLRDVLFELAQQAEYDLELDPNIRGSIIYTARERPFDQVVERISDISGLRFKFEDDVLRVELDTPYNKTYRIDYLNFVRTNKSSISNDISVVSGDEADTGSDFEAKNESESDFWGELEASMTQILGNAENRSLRTKRDPRITAVEQNPEVAAVAPVEGEGGVTVQAPEATLRVDALPVDDEDDSGSRSGRGGNSPGFSFAVNRQAGLVTVYGNQRAHKEVAEYLGDLKKSSTAQVLIEAKILEVTLRDEFAAGIDWTRIGGLSTKGLVRFGTTATGAAANVGTNVLNAGRPALDTVSEAGNNFVLGYLGSDVQALVQALQGFGTTKALASPRLTVLNNQSAVLNVATNVVYFEVDVDVQAATVDTPRSVEIDSEIKNVPEGVLVNVQPAIDLEKQTVTMSVRPTITRITQRVADPGIEFIAAESGVDIESLIPELNVQEIDSIIQLRSGQPIVMGGLLQDRVQQNISGVPVLGEMPFIGSAFRNTDDQVRKTELVILLKATIVDPSQTIHNTDKDLYRQFSEDRRPFSL